MSSAILSSSVFAILAIFFISLSLASLIYGRGVKKKTLGATTEGVKEGEEEDWLFSGFHEAVFNLFYKDAKSDKLGGIDKAEYARYCKLLHRKNDFKNIVAMRMEGSILFLFCLLLAWIFSDNILFMAAFGVVGFAGYYLLYSVPYKKIQNQAEERLFHIQDDLPRYLSLLEKAMDMPIDKAMMLTATKFPSPLSEDIMDSIHKVSLGAEGWETTLMDLARTYNLEVFSDLVLEIIHSYDQGMDIRPVVTRKAKEVEEQRMFIVEAHDSKIKTLIYLPIIGLKILPLMAMICLPMLKDFI